MIISEQEKNRIRKLHKEFSLIKEQDDVKGKEEVSKINGISTSLLHPVTQNWLRKGKSLNVFRMIQILAECHWKGSEIDADNPMEVISPMGLGSSSTDNPEVRIKDKNSPGGPKFCLIGKSGRQQDYFCINPCKTQPYEGAWSQVKGWRFAEDKIVPAMIKYMKGSTIDNRGGSDESWKKYTKGGDMLGWRADGDGIDAKFTLKRV